MCWNTICVQTVYNGDNFMILKGDIEVQHKGTGEKYKVTADDLYQDYVNSDAGGGGGMGQEIQHSYIFEHPELGDLLFEWWEYPKGAFNDKKYQINGHTVISDNFKVEF